MEECVAGEVVGWRSGRLEECRLEECVAGGVCSWRSV